MVEGRGYRSEMHGIVGSSCHPFHLTVGCAEHNGLLAKSKSTISRCYRNLKIRKGRLGSCQVRYPVAPIEKPSMNGSRLRNHDLLTSLDVLTTGSYRRLPSCIKVCAPIVSVAESYCISESSHSPGASDRFRGVGNTHRN
jgi:hypothetical protein